MGAVHYGAGNLDEALACQRKALDIVGVLDARAEIANYTAELGKTYWRLKKNEEALRYMLQAIALAEELGLEHHGSEYHRIAGRLCLRMGQMQAAHTHMDAALQLAIRSGIPAQHVAALEGINALHTHEGNYHAALHNAEQALHLARAIGEKRLIALGHGRLGDLDAMLEQHSEAGRELEQAVRELRALGVSPNAPALPYYLLLLADVLLHQGNLAEAEARGDEAQRIVAAHAATLFEGKALAVQSAMIRARCRYARGHHDEAVRALTSLVTTTDDPDHHARLWYTLWQLTEDAIYASQALDAYQQLQSPAAPFSYQQRIAMLRRAGFDG